MKLVIAFLVAVGFMMAADPGVKYFGHEKVAKGGNLVTASDLTVLVNHRDKAGEVEVHDKETDVMYVLEGEATFITGGKMIGGKSTAAGQSRGKDIDGGQSQHLSKGDVIVVPAGVPHWFKEVPKGIDYYVVKVIKP
jgi:quercetin dioxygenase-like cupin family protein